MGKIFKAVFVILLAVLITAAALVGWLSITEYRPKSVEKLEVSGGIGHPGLATGEELKILCWNIGYGGLGKESDFFMDGGEKVQAADEAQVRAYLKGIKATVDKINPQLLMLQEVDSDSRRSYGIDQRTYFGGSDDNAAYAMNYSCNFVPFPLPPIGKVHSGLFTLAEGYAIEQAERHALPCPFKWPVSTANLKRCLLVCYMPIEGCDKQLVLVNLHLEAYDDGEGKIAQTKQLRDFISAEYEKGNYVIAAGDFNQIFPGSLDFYPNSHPELWTPGTLDSSMLPEGWTLAYDMAVPTCRLLNQSYDPADQENTQHYVIDGFILSPNVELVNVETLDEGFANSDHNPVALKAILKQ